MEILHNVRIEFPVDYSFNGETVEKRLQEKEQFETLFPEIVLKPFLAKNHTRYRIQHKTIGGLTCSYLERRMTWEAISVILQMIEASTLSWDKAESIWIIDIQ